MERKALIVVLLSLALAGCSNWNPFVRAPYDVNLDALSMSDCDNLPELTEEENNIVGALNSHVETKRLYRLCLEKNKTKGQALKNLHNVKIIRITTP